MRCTDATMLVSTRRDLNPAQRAELDAHLASCRACAVASREEQHTSRLLAALPNADVAVPPRVAVAVRGLAARRAAEASLRRSVALAASLGAVALVAAVLLNMVAGGRLLGPGVPAQTAGQPAGAPVAPQPTTRTLAGGDTLFLIATDSVGREELVAWSPALRQERYRVTLGRPLPEERRWFVGSLRPGYNVAFSPDGRTIYAVVGGSAAALVALNAADGRQLWRSELGALVPLSSNVGQGRLTVTPDGEQVLLQVVDGVPEQQQGETYFASTRAIRAYDAASGRAVGEPTALPSGTDWVLPLGGGRLLVGGEWVGLTFVTLGARPPWGEALDETAVAATLLPDGKTIYALAANARLLVIDAEGERPQLRETIDLAPQGGFFFEYAAFSPDGSTLALGRTNRDAQGQVVSSELRIFRAENWSNPQRRRFDLTPLEGLAVSADGVTVYASFGPAELRGTLPPTGSRILTDPTLPALLAQPVGPRADEGMAQTLGADITGLAGVR